jgi:formylglycine-generating enzyme required for sulfatase activity
MSAIDFGGTDSPYLTVADAAAIKAAKMPTEVHYTGYPEGIPVYDYATLAAYSTSSCNSGSPSTSCWDLTAKVTDLLYGGNLNSVDNLVWYPNTDVDGGTTTVGEDRNRDNYPMCVVSWYGSLAFSLWLGGSLPTEAQWEYAARQKSNGTTDNSYYYAGASANTDAGLDAVGWHGYNSSTHAHEVGKKSATGKGLFDMSGSISEWVIDQHGSYMNAAGNLTATSGKNLVSANESNTGASSGAPLYNPVAYPSSGSARVFHGGDWSCSASSCKLSSRYYHVPSGEYNYVGFRCVVCP